MNHHNAKVYLMTGATGKQFAVDHASHFTNAT